MSTIEELLHTLKTIGNPTYEQDKKIHEGKLVMQERYVINIYRPINELDAFQISNFCKIFKFRCEVILMDSGVHNHLQIQFFKKEEK